MTPECSRVMDSLGGPLPADLATHVATCEDCKSLVGGFDALGGGAGASMAGAPAGAPAVQAGAPARMPRKLDTARELALRELAAHPKPTPWWRELLVLLSVYGVVLVVGLLALGRHGLVGNLASPMVVAVVAVLTLVLVSGGAFVALAPRWRRLPWALVALAVVGVGVAQVLGGSGLPSARPPMDAMLRCMGTELLLSVLPVAAALVLLCRTAFQPVRALAAGLSAAGVSLLVLHLHCADGTARHLLSAHLLPWLLLAAVAVYVRSRMPTRSYAP